MTIEKVIVWDGKRYNLKEALVLRDDIMGKFIDENMTEFDQFKFAHKLRIHEFFMGHREEIKAVMRDIDLLDMGIKALEDSE